MEAETTTECFSEEEYRQRSLQKSIFYLNLTCEEVTVIQLALQRASIDENEWFCNKADQLLYKINRKIQNNLLV